MKNYVTVSLETHLFFERIMKEHAFFLLAGFPEKEEAFRNTEEAAEEFQKYFSPTGRE